ncbi:hypothetical protein [Antarcticirhabdus aurantiaca]|uniref:Uncharacterized protein n=1 Tax=Antarcticirhabdus aurantiaca TaxID=2606717 RepID=A0ACD4NRN0_9HYPH|nr:hypothetical protein [Antarcticirhabdus aurantiaca]WAJ29452.1 hypothetical protein OXU80_04225 [Jeongeuplla avenae]
MARAIAQMLRVAGAMLLFWAGGPAAAGPSVTVTANGRHPSQLQWDGVRVYWLPFDVSTISAADLVACAVQDRVACSGVPCPDADRCEFELPSVDASRPFALIVYDWDGLLEDEVSAAARGLSVGSDAVASLKGLVADPAWGARADGAADAASGLLAAASDALGEANGRRLEFMDAAILVPSPDMADQPALAALVREHVGAAARLDGSVLGVRRLRGPIATLTYADCVWPSPACALAYADIEFKEKEKDHEAD